MKKIFLLLFVTTQFVWSISYDLVDIYRQDGINPVQKILDQQLTKKEYWEQYLENKFTKYGYYESIQYVMVSQKHMKNIFLYDTKNNKELFSSSVFVGEKKGDKKVEGDLKTPVGAYKLTNRITTLDPFYGPLALATNYPNLLDQSQGKTGHGIWIHGLPEEGERDDFTQGCIALENPNMLKLDQSINIKNSILLISEDNYAPAKKNHIATILASVFAWRDAWKYSDIDTYLSFYDQENFLRSNGQRIEEFTQSKTRLFQRDEKKKIIFSNINVIPYPNDANKVIYKVIMDELYETKTYKFQGKKEIFVELQDGTMKILAES
jgi:murein L,D-transpeptidase YafK